MLRSNNNLLYSIALRNAHDIAFPTHTNDRAYFAVVTPMGHAFLNTRINFYYYTVSRLISMEQFAKSHFASFPWAFPKEAACFGSIPF
jgi:hypothetical protein